MSIDVDQRLFTLLGNPLEALTDTTRTNLSTFSARGGKLLFYHGMSDQAFSAMDTLDYYQPMAKANGGTDKVQATNLTTDSTELSGDAAFNNIEIGNDASTLDKGKRFRGSITVF